MTIRKQKNGIKNQVKPFICSCLGNHQGESNECIIALYDDYVGCVERDSKIESRSKFKNKNINELPFFRRCYMNKKLNKKINGKLYPGKYYGYTLFAQCGNSLNLINKLVGLSIRNNTNPQLDNKDRRKNFTQHSSKISKCERIERWNIPLTLDEKMVISNHQSGIIYKYRIKL